MISDHYAADYPRIFEILLQYLEHLQEYLVYRTMGETYKEFLTQPLGLFLQWFEAFFTLPADAGVVNKERFLARKESMISALKEKKKFVMIQVQNAFAKYKYLPANLYII